MENTILLFLVFIIIILYFFYYLSIIIEIIIKALKRKQIEEINNYINNNVSVRDKNCKIINSESHIVYNSSTGAFEIIIDIDTNKN